MTRHPDNPFWRFSIAVYGKPGVAEECLAIQDAFGIDINMLLFAAWVGAERQSLLSDVDLNRLNAISTCWQNEIIKPVRAARQHLKSSTRDLYSDLKRAELTLEQMEQSALFAEASLLTPRTCERDHAINTNLAAVLHQHDVYDFPVASLVAATRAYSAILT